MILKYRRKRNNKQKALLMHVLASNFSKETHQNSTRIEDGLATKKNKQSVNISCLSK